MLELAAAFREKLYDAYRSAPLDAASFHRNYRACGMGECMGLCCHGGSGFYLPEEADIIREAVTANREFFHSNIPDLPDQLFDEETDEATGEVALSTNTKPATYPEGLKPAHFPETACVFKRADGACTLQTLGISEGKHGWSYKPYACWLYPIELDYAGKPHIRVAHASTDEYVDAEYPGFVGFTKCGAECPDTGKPAYEVLANEIAMLSRLLDRDLMKEILSHTDAA
jgi:hypothetical protein